MARRKPPRPTEWTLRLPRRAALAAAVAFGIGLLLFLAVWLRGREDDFYRAEPVVVGPAATDMAPLPQPLPAGEPASTMPEAGEPREDAPRLVETAPAPVAAAEPAAVAAPDSAAAPPADDAPPGNGLILAPGDRPVPIEGRSPPPRYPPAALRAGRSGTVTVRVDVDAQGIPAGVALIQRSGSREFDRAAMEAVRRWRFHPAQRDGRAVPASLAIPITFDAGR